MYVVAGLHDCSVAHLTHRQYFKRFIRTKHKYIFIIMDFCLCGWAGWKMSAHRREARPYLDGCVSSVWTSSWTHSWRFPPAQQQKPVGVRIAKCGLLWVPPFSEMSSLHKYLQNVLYCGIIPHQVRFTTDCYSIWMKRFTSLCLGNLEFIKVVDGFTGEKWSAKWRTIFKAPVRRVFICLRIDFGT